MFAPLIRLNQKKNNININFMKMYFLKTLFPIPQVVHIQTIISIIISDFSLL